MIARSMQVGGWWLALAGVLACFSGCTTQTYERGEKTAPIAMLAYSPDGRTLAAVRREANRITLLDAHTLTVRGELGGISTGQASHGPVSSLGFSRDGRRLVAAGIDDTVIVWDLASRTELFRRAELNGARKAALSPDGMLVAVAGPGHDASVWRIAEKERIGDLKGHFEDVTSVAFAHRGDLIATGGADRTVRLWSLAPTTSVTLPAWHRAGVTELVFSPDDALLAVSAGMLDLWRVADRRLIGHALEPAEPAQVPPAAQALVTLLMVVASARSIQLGGGPLGVPPVGGVTSYGPVGVDLQIAFSADGGLLAVLRRVSPKWGNGEVLIAEVAGRKVTRIVCECFAIAFHPDGRAIATGGEQVQLWNPGTGERLVPSP